MSVTLVVLGIEARAKEVADALEDCEELFAEGPTVNLTDIAGPASFLRGTLGSSSKRPLDSG